MDRIGHDYTFKQYGRRWLMMLIIFWLNTVTQIIYMAFAPIATASAQYYDVNLTAINWLALIWTVLYAPGTALAGYCFYKYRFRRCMLLSAAGLMLAAAVRCISLAYPVQDGVKTGVGSYIWVLLGSMIAGCVQPFIMASTTLLASSWFSEKQRNLANSLMAIANPLGLAAGAVLAPLIAQPDETPLPDGVNPTALRMPTLLLLHLALAASAFLATLALQTAPPTAPSGTAARPVAAFDSLRPDIAELRNNLPFFALLHIFSLAVGAFVALITLMEQILSPQGYSANDAGLVSAVLIVCGIVGAAITGPILDITRSYKLILAVCITAALPLLVGFTVLAQRRDVLPDLAILGAVFGLVAFPILPTALDLAAEVSYPVHLGLATGVLWSGSQVTALVLIVLIDGPLAATAPSGEHELQAGSWLIVGCVAAAVMLSWMWTGKYLRLEAEEAIARLRQAQRRDMAMPFVDIVGGGDVHGHAVVAQPSIAGLSDAGDASAVLGSPNRAHLTGEVELGTATHRKGDDSPVVLDDA